MQMLDFYFDSSLFVVSDRAKTTLERAALTGLHFQPVGCWLDPDPAYGRFTRRKWIEPPLWRVFVDNAAQFAANSRFRSWLACPECGRYRFHDRQHGHPELAEAMVTLDVANVAFDGLIVSGRFKKAVINAGLSPIVFQPLEELNLGYQVEWRTRRDEILRILQNQCREQYIVAQPGDDAGDDSPYLIPPLADPITPEGWIELDRISGMRARPIDVLPPPEDL